MPMGDSPRVLKEMKQQWNKITRLILRYFLSKKIIHFQQTIENKGNNTWFLLLISLIAAYKVAPLVYVLPYLVHLWPIFTMVFKLFITVLLHLVNGFLTYFWAFDRLSRPLSLLAFTPCASLHHMRLLFHAIVGSPLNFFHSSWHVICLGRNTLHKTFK